MKCPKCGTEFYGYKCPNCGYEPSEYEIAISTLMQLTGVGRRRAEELYKAGYKDIESIAKSDESDLAKVHSIGKELAKKIKKEALSHVEVEQVEFVNICPVCGAIVPPGSDRCPRCGAPIGERAEEKKAEEEEEEERWGIEDRAICPFCGALIPKDSAVCPVCGANLENVALEEPKPLEDPMEVLKRFFGVQSIPQGVEESEEEADIRVCPNCGAIVVNKEVCPFCGTPLPKIEPAKQEEVEIDFSETLNICPNCGAFIPPDVSVCPICGAKIEEEREEEQAISLADVLKMASSAAGGAAAMEYAGEGEAEAIHEVEQEIKSQEEISIEELEEIESTIKGELEEVEELGTSIVKESEIEEAMGEIISAIPEEEVGAKELEEIEETLERERVGIGEEKPLPEVIEVESREATPPAGMEEFTFSDKLNSFIYSFGTREDILSFSPLLVSLIFIATLGFLSESAMGIFTATVSMVMFSLGAVMALIIYRGFGKFSKIEHLLGVGVSLSVLLTLFPYSTYLMAAAAIGIVILRLSRSYNHWIPYTVATMSFALQSNYAYPLAILFVSLFSVHLIHRYGEMSFEITSVRGEGENAKEEGMRAFQEKRYYDAIYLLRRALRSNPRDLQVLNTLGLAYGRIGNADMALEMFRKIVEIDPNYKVAWNNMGNVYARMEDYDKAIECYRKALKIDPNYSDALLNLGYVMIRKGSYAEAMKVAERIKAMT